MVSTLKVFGVFLLAATILAARPALAADKVSVKVIKFPELAKTVKQSKGKVVVIDFWALW